MADRSRRPRKGKVSLVGAGPGDAQLLTLGGLDRLTKADVVIYDRLVSKAVLGMIPRGVTKIYGGKGPGSGAEKEQKRLNDLMLHEAESGKDVVRLKGGDPFLFSRGGEEAEFLRDHGVDFEVVPGVSSALAVPAYAGIPLTHRGYSSSVTVVTGRNAGSRKPDWSKIAGGSDVVVVLMGAAKAREIAQRMLKAGKAPDTPLAAVMRGTTKRQRTVITTLSEAAKVGGVSKEMEAPSVIVVGRVVSLARKLRWLHERA
jgi:uroporphyrin-III C-methyltransferase